MSTSAIAVAPAGARFQRSLSSGAVRAAGPAAGERGATVAHPASNPATKKLAGNDAVTAGLPRRQQRLDPGSVGGVDGGAQRLELGLQQRQERQHLVAVVEQDVPP